MIRDKKKLEELKVRRRGRVRSFYLHEDVWKEFDRIGFELDKKIGGSELLGIMIEEFKLDQV